MRARAALILSLVLAACQPAAAGPTAPTGAGPTTEPTPAAPSGDAPTHKPAIGGLIVFQRSGEHGGIFTIDPNGAGETKLLPGDYQTPRWSPTGEQLALSHILDDEKGVVVPAISGPGGADARDVPLAQEGLHCGSPVWDARGTVLALECWGDDAKDDGIYLVTAADGGDLKRLTHGHGIPGGFSPDGRQVVFTDPEGALAMVGTDGSAAYLVGRHEVGAYPGFLPDGASLFATVDGAIVIFDLVGNVIRKVRAPESRMSEARLSPDGTQFVFVYDPHDVPSPGLARIGIDGQGFADILRATAAGAENLAPDWSR